MTLIGFTMLVVTMYKTCISSMHAIFRDRCPHIAGRGAVVCCVCCVCWNDCSLLDYYVLKEAL